MVALRDALQDPRHGAVAMAVVAAAAAALDAVVVARVPYTEIDWVAYMQEVRGWLGGELDYAALRGDTGPLVYPAGFVYLYALLHEATDGGADIRAAQWIFAALHVALVAVVVTIMRRLQMPPWTFVAAVASRRIVSIFVLRLFNDGVAALLAYASVLAFVDAQWALGCVLYSLGVGVKMNVLLYAPGLLLLLWQAHGVARTVGYLGICAAIQIALAWPFLAAHPWSYLSRAFEFSRVFMFRWTVNWKFVDPALFVSPAFALVLLAAHLALLAVFLHRYWVRGPPVQWTLAGKPPRQLAADHVVGVLFVAQFCGIVCARSLHYQFYAWYYHTLPVLLWILRVPILGWGLVLGTIELALNIYPATPGSSLLLQAGHGIVLLLLVLRIRGRRQGWAWAYVDEDKKTN